MTILGTLTENPNTNELNKQQKDIEKKIISDETQKEITTEEFRNMDWKYLEKNIRVAPDGSLTLFGKKMIYWLFNDGWNSEKTKGYTKFKEKYIDKQKKFIEKIRNQSKKVSLLKNILKIWTPEAQKQAYGVWFTSLGRDNKKIILGDVKKIGEKISEFGIPISDEILNNETNDIFDLMKNAEQEESIIGEDDLEKVKKIFFDENLNNKQKEIKILNIMRYGGLSGNSEGVKNVIADKLLKKEEFKKENEILKNPKLQEYLEDKNIDKLKKILGGKEKGKELSEKLIKIYDKTKENLNKKLEASLESFNKEREKRSEKILTIEEYKKLKKEEIKSGTLQATLNTFKHILIYNHIEEKKFRGTENSLTGTYANIVGLGKEKGFFSDGITFSDDNIDNVIDFSTTLVIGAITMGAGIAVSVGTRAVLTSARAISIGNKVAKGLKITQYLEKGTKSAKVLSFVGNATLEGVAFYEGATVMQNLMFKNLEDWNKGLLDGHEIIKSIAFMGALNSLKYFSKIPGMGKIGNFGDKIGKKYLKKEVILKVLKGTGTVVLEGTSMFAISQIIDKLLGDGWNPTVEGYLQFIALIQVMKLKDMRK